MKKLLSILLAIMLMASLPVCASAESREFSQDATIEETVLVDDYDVKITATDLTYGNSRAEIDLLIENNSDKDLTFLSGTLGYSCNSVNGYMTDGYLNCDVAAGKKTYESISISYSTLMLYGIYEIADIELGFYIRDDDSNYTYIEPCRILTSAAEDYDYSVAYYRENIASAEAMAEFNYTVNYFSQDPVYEENGLTIASVAVMKNSSGNSILLLEVVNDTDTMVDVSTSDININGLRCTSSTWDTDTINPGKTAIAWVTLSSVLEPEYFELLGISEIGNVSLTVSFEDQDNNEVSSPVDLSIDIPGADASFSTDGTEVYNDNGVRIIPKGICESASEYNDDLYVILIAENTSGDTMTLSIAYDSLSVNDFMTSYSFYSKTVEDGEWAMLEIRLWASGLEDINITDISQVETVELTLEIRDQDYNDIDEPTITITVE